MDRLVKIRLHLITSGKYPLYMELIALFLLSGLGILWWWNSIYLPAWTPDGNTYQSAIDLVIEGRSPYEHYVYPYPPTIALIGAWINKLWGEEAFRIGFRYVNLLGGCAAVWGSLLLTRWPWFLRLGLGSLGILFLPTLASCVDNDNLSMLASGTTIVGIILWPHLPILTGILLGFGLSLKPIGLIALFLLAAHRPPAPQRKHFLTSGIAAFTATILFSISPKWFLSGLFHPNVKAAALDWATGVLNVSFYRIFSCFGLKLSPLVFLSIFLVLGLIYVRRGPLNRGQLVCVACTGSLLSLPIVWKHTLLLVLPVQCMAMAVALRRSRQIWKRTHTHLERKNKLRSLSQLLLVTAGCVTVLEADGYGVIGNWHPWVNGITLLIPITTLILLTGYVVRHESEPIT
ncbi:MAG: hypothetical protein ABII26_11400 [Pseudomonadota bacterium]